MIIFDCGRVIVRGIISYFSGINSYYFYILLIIILYIKEMKHFYSQSLLR
ncbi:hypothetical protein Patl1_15480 [Pistacia atlantica]|uniref:Uncharacterized protein n=1 Tax=Pistacia atlantica TaxID=434234 RepID=A0ACC1B5J8_9ROSI|nr:hypothetical protein Patl1_15480 [Pistacia atlantica]